MAKAGASVTVREALAFVRRHGVVLMSARGPVPNLAETIAGGPIRGSWWAHPAAHAIFRIATAVAESADVLVCRLVDGKITFVHRRLWPALARLSDDLPRTRIAAVRDEHTPRGHHRTVTVPFSRSMPEAVWSESRRLTKQEAVALLGEDLVRRATGGRS